MQFTFIYRTISYWYDLSARQPWIKIQHWGRVIFCPRLPGYRFICRQALTPPAVIYVKHNPRQSTQYWMNSVRPCVTSPPFGFSIPATLHSTAFVSELLWLPAWAWTQEPPHLEAQLIPVRCRISHWRCDPSDIWLCCDVPNCSHSSRCDLAHAVIMHQIISGRCNTRHWHVKQSWYENL